MSDGPPTGATGCPAIAPLLQWALSVRGVVTQLFGEHAVDYRGYGLIGHNGIDIAVPGGARASADLNLHSPIPGEAWAYDDPQGYGLTVEVWYPHIKDGLYKVILAHMAGQWVKTGDMVYAGTILGVMGSTGNSTGRHTHLGYKVLAGVNPGYRNWIDPWPYMVGRPLSPLAGSPEGSGK